MSNSSIYKQHRLIYLPKIKTDRISKEPIS